MTPGSSAVLVTTHYSIDTLSLQAVKMPVDMGGMLKKGLLEELEGLSFPVRMKACVSVSFMLFDFVLFLCIT